MRTSVAAVIALLALSACGSESDEEPQESASDRKKTDAIAACQNAVLDRLKAPSTADFVSSSAVGAFVVKVKGEVDAQNPMGAMVRSSYECDVLFDSENNVRPDDITVNVVQR
ncbi:hypothetical protein [Aeromicrobium marinum]|nr:hypothetical protein [Aeromicrobium marinum]